MSFSINFEVVQDEDGTKRLVPGHNGFNTALMESTPVGPYTVSGHVAVSDEDWGESVSVTTPIGYASSSSISRHVREQTAARRAEAAKSV